MAEVDRTEQDEKGNFRTYFKDGGFITWGRVTQPPVWSEKQKQQEWSQAGYWWIAFEGKPHPTLIVKQKPVEGKDLAVVQVLRGDARDPGVWDTLAVAIIGFNELELT